MSDDRRDAAELVTSVRRYLERERAGGGADLLADGATRAGRSGTSGAVGHHVPPGPPTPPARPEPPGHPVPPDRPEPPGDPVPPVPPDRPEPPGRPEPQVPPARPAPPARRSSAPAPELPALDAVFRDLNPAGLDARAAIADASLPVLAGIAEEVNGCTKCGLCNTRTRAVPGVGTARGGIVFVGEAPGADEDRLGEPFVGRAGQLLDKIIKAMDEAKLIPGLPLDRRHVFICNVLKCRPPENRNPLPHEIATCSPYLRRQLAAIRPRIICCLGKFAAELLVGVEGTIRDLRGKVHHHEGAKLIVTYHPAACLRNPAYKRPVWEDMQLLAREYLSD